MEINKTPVRTANNFKINNINLKNFSFPSKVSSFEDIEVINTDTKVIVNNQTSPISLTYGLGEELTSLVKNSSNSKLSLTINSKTNKEIIVNYNFSKNDVLLEDIEITSNEDTKETVIIKYCSKNPVFHDGIIRANTKKNSMLNIIVVNLLEENSNNFLTFQNRLDETSSLNYTIIDLGSKLSITNFYSNIMGNSAKSNVNGIYIARKEQLLDLNYIAELYGKNTNVNIDFQGALLDNAKKHFKGTIDFKKGAIKSTGSENEACMLLSNSAKSLSLPMLLCSEEDVDGAHSSSAGKIDEKELFYIMTRGFSRKDAQKLLVKAKFNNILKGISNVNIKDEIIDVINNKLD